MAPIRHGSGRAPRHAAQLGNVTELPSATTFDGTPIYVGSRVSVNTQTGARPALVRRLFTSQYARPQAHVQWLKRSYAGKGNELFLRQGCTNINTRSILRPLNGRVRFVAEPGVWRDPLPPAAHSPAVDGRDPFSRTSCDSCLERARNAPHVVHIIDGPSFFKMGGEEYHPGDLVFVAEGRASGPWTPGVLCRSHRGEEEWGVRLCGWYADLARGSLDETRLYLTEDARLVPLNSIRKAQGITCPYLLPRHAAPRRRSLVPLPHGQYALPNPSKPPNGLGALRPPAVDLYAGGGGLLYGINEHFDVQHAVELDPAACATLRDNFPALSVHRCTVDDFMRSRRRRPEPGSVALLVAGPPCQGLTTGNHHRALAAPSNREIFTTLREVERVRPDVFVLENVPGIAAPFHAGSVNVLEQVVRQLVGRLRYQVRLGKLNSRDFGSPQDRQRIFVLAVRRGLPLPSWPAPTHANPRPSVLTFTVGDEAVTLGGGGGGPRRAITARDAIGDFPQWDYSGSPAVDFGDRVGLPNGTPYRRPPMTAYQRSARGDEAGVRDHVTQIPSLSRLDLVRSAPRADEARAGRGAELRCDPHGAVPTIQSNPFPGGNSACTIHWNSHRVLSVAERRRVQGLPDSYILRGSVKDKDRMLGNMVDVHVADALAAHIKREVFAPSWRKWGRPAGDEFWRMWREAHPV